MSTDFDSGEENLVWLKCDKQYLGKTLVRKGKRLDLPETNEKEPRWVFCSLKEENRKKRLIPNTLERVLIMKCEKCPHFKGYERHQAPSTCEIKPVGLPILEITKETVQKATKMANEEDKKWLSAEGQD